MTITPHLFEAFLKCQTKCWLRSINEPATGNAYADWSQSQNESYRSDSAKRLLETTPETERASAPDMANLKTARWRLAVNVRMRTPEASSPEPRSSRGNEAQTSSTEISQSLLTSAATIVESRLHAVERIPSEGRGKPAHFIPIRFIFTNKLGKES